MNIINVIGKDEAKDIDELKELIDCLERKAIESNSKITFYPYSKAQKVYGFTDVCAIIDDKYKYIRSTDVIISMSAYLENGEIIKTTIYGSMLRHLISNREINEQETKKN